MVIMFSVFAFAACAGEDDRLSAPDNLRVQAEILLWDRVDGASAYKIFADGKMMATTEACYYDLSELSLTEEEECVLNVRAIPEDKEKAPSALSRPFAYTPSKEGEDATNSAGEFGTEERPYVISTKEDLENIFIWGADKCYVLGNDLELGEWTPLGAYSQPHGDRSRIPGLAEPFSGLLIGDGHTISYTINISDTDADKDYGWGLFGISEGATFRYLKIEATIQGAQPANSSSSVAGGLTGWAKNCRFDCCETSGTIRQDHNGSANYGCIRSGGLVGMAEGCAFYRCTNRADVLAGGFFASAGGIVGGQKDCDFDSCVNHGEISSNHGSWLFGGDNHGDLYGRT
ncbi:MAG: hypothetical protein J6Y74_05455 [Clostridia bacterium]|nr:hypothetical protein [Clostridia bacterium]